MEFRNMTPFPSLAYMMLDVEDAMHHVVVTRITYDLIPLTHGDFCLHLASKQEPLVMEDQYYGEMNCSSVKQESDLAPFKPKCDVIVINAAAYAPAGREYRKFSCSVRVGNIQKNLCVTGPRVWQWRLLRWTLLEPEPVTEVALRYENSFGGALRCPLGEGSKKEFYEVYTRNPVGKGWMPTAYPKREACREFSAPQIEAEDKPVLHMDKEYAPEGFGVIGRPWTPRLQAAGTYDAAWKKERWPKLPKDFDFSYWNGAHPDLCIPYPAPDSEIELRRLTPEGKVLAKLPGHRAFVLARFQSGIILPLPTVIDTLCLDMASMQVSVVWRTRVPEALDVRVLEARFEMDIQAPLMRM